MVITDEKVEEWVFPKSRIKDTRWLVEQIKEIDSEKSHNLCFVLGSGASVESGIPTGQQMEMNWMNDLMGVKRSGEDRTYKESYTRKLADEMISENRLKASSFDEIKKSWDDARENGTPMDSKYYFDVYKLRFEHFPDKAYRFLEKAMEGCEPSLGYYSLALMLTNNNDNNLVLTTNFDSLTEDALFIYTSKKPLVIGHEALVGYLDISLKRPIVAKLHNSLLLGPKSDPNEVSKLSEIWKEALRDIFKKYTPVVIGYGGGDNSLMEFLKHEANLDYGVFWCYYRDEIPDQDILKFIDKNNGHLVKTDGFDSVMLALGNGLFPGELDPAKADALFEGRCRDRKDFYNEHWKKLNPDDPIEKDLLDKAKDTEEAREKEGKLTAMDYIRRAFRAKDEARYAEAIESFSKALILDPNDHINRYNRGLCYDEADEKDKALEDYTMAIEIQPDYVLPYNNRGILYCKQKKYSEALADFNKAIELNPEHANAYFNRGLALAEQGELVKALSDFDNTIQLKPGHSKAYRCRAWIYHKMGEETKAQADKEKAEELDRQKNYREAQDYNRRGTRALLSGKLDRAVELFTKAINQKSDYVKAYFNRARAYGQMHKYDDSIADYNKVIEMNPKHAEAYINRGYTYDEKGDYDKAIEDNTIAIKLDPDNVTAYINRSFIFYHKREYEKALEDANYALKLDNEDPYAYCNKGLAYDGLGNFKEAIKAFDDCLRLLPENDSENRALAYVYRGRTFFHNMEYGKSLENYSTALSLKPNCSKALRGRAKTYRALGRKGLALADDKHAKKIERELETT